MNPKKENIILLVLAIIIIALIVVLLWPINRAKNSSQAVDANNPPSASQQQVQGIQVTSPTLDQQVSSPFTITGSINEGGWSAFEGQVGSVELLDNKGNVMAKDVLKATTDWTKSPVQFSSTIIFQSTFKGVATLLFSNENASGAVANNKEFGLPVVIK